MIIDVMVDIESFGNGRRPSIIQIGAVYFNRRTGWLGERFKRNIDARTSGGVIDADTVYWWMRQNEEARASIAERPLCQISEVLKDLNVFLSAADCIWSHATYDFVQIMETYQLNGIEPSFSHKAARDIRTLLDLANVRTIELLDLAKASTSDFKREGIHHDALADAIYQVSYCVEAFKRLTK